MFDFISNLANNISGGAQEYTLLSELEKLKIKRDLPVR